MTTKLSSTNSIPFSPRQRKFINDSFAALEAKIATLESNAMLRDGSNANLPTTNQASPALWSNSNVVNRGTA